MSEKSMTFKKQENNHIMILDHIGFAAFLFFLLIAPKIPIYISGGSERSSISLGFIGFIIWFLLCPGYLFRFPRPPSTSLILIFFAYYAFLISLISTKLISIIYGAQFLFYVIFSTIFFRKYLLKAKSASAINTSLKIFIIIMIIFAAGALISVFTGPIYPWQTIYTLRPWGDMWIRQGVGFSEGQNLTAEVLIIFATAAIYLYKGDKAKKFALISLALIALISTLCRSPIIAFFVAITALQILELVYSILISNKINKKYILSITYLVIAVMTTFFVAGGILYSLNRHLLEAILSGFEFGKSGTLLTDLNTRISLWSSGIDIWASSTSTTSVLFGDGFRSSMGIIPETGAWLTSHNLFITILAEFGIIGLIIFILFFAISAISDLRIIFKGDNITTGTTARFRFVAILAIMIHNLAGEFLYSPVLISMLIFITISNLQDINSKGKR